MQASTRPLRLLLMTDTAILAPGGSERFLRNLLDGLAGENYAIDVLQLSPAPEPAACVAHLDHTTVRLLHQPVRAVYGPPGLAAYRAVRRRVLHGDYDIVQSQHEKSDLINALLPRVTGVSRISNRRDMGFQKNYRVRAAFRRANARFDRIVAPSRTILDALVAGENADSGRCVAIPNGVDTTRFHAADAAQRTRLRDALGFGADECLVGCVASFTPVKRHDILLAAFAQARRRFPQARLLLVGDGPLRGEVEAQARESGVNGAIHFLGARADVENILPALDVFALSSTTEGMSNAILEAQACGVAVVATAVGGNTELVQAHATGVLVPALQPDALANALADIIGAPARRSELGSAARRRVEREYSTQAMVAGYQRLYRELAHAC
jgi:glycosyltransferase involved in cell wall biosynthesis